MEVKYIMQTPVEDIIFENRNKEYGAYDIRKKYNRNVGIATAVAVSLLLLFIFGPVVIGKLIPEEELVVETTRPTVTTLGPPPDLTETPPPPPEQIIEPPKQIEFTVPEVVEEEVADEPPPTQTEQREQNTGQTTEEGPVDLGPPPAGDPILPPEPPKEENFEFAQEMPRVKINLQDFFSNHVKYPDLAWETRVEGTVYVKAVVKANGSIDPSTIQVGKGLRGGGAGLNDEAVRVVKLIPPGSFSPGSNNGNPVNVWISIPVRFVITD